jgi:hypothetical protein
VSKDMKAYRLILTHFSQRYPSVPALPPVALDYVLLAFDFMRVRFQDLLWAPSVMPALVEAFPPGATEDENDDDVVEILGGGKQKEKENGKEKIVGKESAKGKNDESSKKRKVACRCHEWVSEIELEQGLIADAAAGAGAVASSDQNKSITAPKMCGFCSSGGGKVGLKQEAKSNNRKSPRISG